MVSSNPLLLQVTPADTVFSGAASSKVVKSSMDSGLIVLKAGRNTVRFLPPLTISKSEIDKGFERFEKAISSI